MSIFKGSSTPSKIYIGSTEITSAFVGGASPTQVWPLVSSNIVEYIAIGGGGSGGSWYSGGGGGAGGYRSSIVGEETSGCATPYPAYTITPSEEYTVTVGAGASTILGRGGYVGTSSSFKTSTGSTIISSGAGGGGRTFDDGALGFNRNSTSQCFGASGGGGGGDLVWCDGGLAFSTYNSPGGYEGGNGIETGSPARRGGGGGGGAGGQGGNATSSNAGNGGIGFLSNVTGVATRRAGGGGGGGYITGGFLLYGGSGGSGGGGNGGTNTSGTNGTANSGGGGGGTGFCLVGGNGGSGLIIFKYPSALTLNIGAGVSATCLNCAVGDYKYTCIIGGTGNICWL